MTRTQEASDICPHPSHPFAGILTWRAVTSWGHLQGFPASARVELPFLHRGDRGEESLGVVKAKPWKLSVGWQGWGMGRGAAWGLEGGLFLDQRLVTRHLGNKKQMARSHLGNLSV